MFALKKIIGTWLMPLPLLLTLALCGVILYRYSRFKRLSRILLSGSFITLFLLSMDPVSTRLAATLEHQHPSYQGQSVEFIHVLGSGHTTVNHLPITSQLSPAALARTIEGVRIYQLNLGAKLIFSGYHGGDENSNARMNANMAIALGVPESAIILLESPQDTIEEAIYSQKVTNGRPFALVTSATHMVRSMQIFQRQGLQPVSAPTAHISKQKSGRMPIHNYFPRAYNLDVSAKVFHEWLGLAWLALRN